MELEYISWLCLLFIYDILFFVCLSSVLYICWIYVNNVLRNKDYYYYISPGAMMCVPCATWARRVSWGKGSWRNPPPHLATPLKSRSRRPHSRTPSSTLPRRWSSIWGWFLDTLFFYLLEKICLFLFSFEEFF